MISAARPAINPGPVIAIVDDDEVVRDSLRAVLETRGYAVRDFASAAELLADAAGRQSTCLLLDVHMPGMTGLELCRALRARGSATPVIFITGRNDPAIAAQAKALGAVMLLDKPIRPATLFATIRSLVAAQ